MRRRIRGLWALTAVAILILVPAALAGSAPTRGAHYAGTLPDYLNNSPKWTAEAHGDVSFQTSSDGRSVRDFRGTYACYCDCGAGLYVRAASIDISRTGDFAYRFSFPQKHERVYVAISGHLAGKDATVSYLVDLVSAGERVAHPYSTKQPSRLGCASWVKGTVATP